MTPNRCLESISNLKCKPQDYKQILEAGDKFVDEQAYGRN